MGVIGYSIIFASVVYLCVFPQTWLPYVQALRRSPPPPAIKPPPSSADLAQMEKSRDGEAEQAGAKNDRLGAGEAEKKSRQFVTDSDRAAMPPPPIIAKAPTIDEAEQTTPKASATKVDDAAVPTFNLLSADAADDEDDDEDPTANLPPPSFPAAFSAQRASGGTRPGLMAPPTRGSPGLMAPPARGAPSLKPPPTASSSMLPPPRNLPIPNRGPLPNRGPPTSGLAPPPTHNSIPTKPSRKVLLTPGHSPLDWARISGPNSDLRNLPPSTPYLRVTKSQLKKYTGRKGKDAWTALGGKVYNMTPYLPFHPGGEPELLRAAGRDGTKLFGEVHPWVNWESMLQSCLVGILVDEEEERQGSKMDEMD